MGIFRGGGVVTQDRGRYAPPQRSVLKPSTRSGIGYILKTRGPGWGRSWRVVDLNGVCFGDMWTWMGSFLSVWGPWWGHFLPSQVQDGVHRQRFWPFISQKNLAKVPVGPGWGYFLPSWVWDGVIFVHLRIGMGSFFYCFRSGMGSFLTVFIPGFYGD